MAHQMVDPANYLKAHHSGGRTRGVVAVAAAGVIAIAQHRDEIPTRTTSRDTRSQVLVQEAIDAALAEAHRSG
jgi:hypothetical protein